MEGEVLSAGPSLFRPKVGAYGHDGALGDQIVHHWYRAVDARIVGNDLALFRKRTRDARRGQGDNEYEMVNIRISRGQAYMYA